MLLQTFTSNLVFSKWTAIFANDKVVITAILDNINSFYIKAEYIAQKIGENIASPYDGGTWRAMYAQLSYQFSTLKLEPVIRYSDYHNPEKEKNQLAIGVNYLFSNNVIAKIGYEFNKDEDARAVNSAANNNRLVAQFAFGF